MSVIITKYLGPTNTLGARVKATLAPGWGEGSVTLHWDYGLSGLVNHNCAAHALAEQLNLVGNFDCVTTLSGYIYIRAGTTAPAFYAGAVPA